LLPGTNWEYSTSLDWTGLVIEAVTGQTLGAYMKQHIFDPLGMQSSTFVTNAEQNARHAFIHQRAPDKHLSEINLKVAYGEKVEVHLGGAGLHSTPADYTAVLLALLNEGAGGTGAQILKKESVDILFQDQTTPMGISLEKTLITAIPELTNTVPLVPGVPKAWTFGGLKLDVNLPSGRSTGSVWWAGIANCFWYAFCNFLIYKFFNFSFVSLLFLFTEHLIRWVDRTKGVAGVIFAQILPFADEQVLKCWSECEQLVYAGL